ncbi:MAG: acetyl-CoA synthase subunit gamma [Deltaproteobacteria bacterium]|nr:acetyl-CoA synthase subunit gamma [Deltaproteobacteria bacterium]MBW1738190.1 acetyl-CoA synthase subunit gamma [Deltaproteobacteria bacterium]MBW1909091.1 acetyl-CoA synthase subunit gamma [Deltaproteobacteria bacterium]MBW2033001.1 acetyl-CoA synthase subunit gamma [Deltaproteobacteria bacterium]MBW2114731.1 acetyl-CoA synthase subunit gamma [Deltaproteobacteria bacterium]
MGLPSLNQPFVEGSIQTRVGPVPWIFSTLALADRWGTIKARWGVGRMRYIIEPGLYALGNPDDQAPVLVTANYKMSFDRLREALPGRHAWILVLDTKGINVWCAAGKGTFGTEELVRRIESSGLEHIVAHRQLILPQLSGPGVAAHQVKKLSGFKVIYGPIMAADLPVFLDAGLKATPDMRRKTFTVRERIVLIPVELVNALKWSLIILPIFFFLGGFGGQNGYWFNALNYGLFAIVALLGAVAAGTVLTPILLPWLPGRAFSVKGLAMGMITVLLLTAFRTGNLSDWAGRAEILAWFLLIPAITAYLAMNFTGASTYTSLSGVKKEMKWAVPLEIAAGAAGLFFWLGSRFVV